MNDKSAGGQHLCKASSGPSVLRGVGPTQVTLRLDTVCLTLTEELVNIPPGPSPALCLVHITSCRSGPSPLRAGESTVASISELVRELAPAGPEKRGSHAEQELLGLRRGSGDKTPLKSHLVRFG